MTTKKSGCGCLSIITILSTLLIAGGYGLNKGWHQFFWGTKLTPLEAAQIIPDEVFLTSYIDTSLSNWSQLEQLNIPEVETVINSIMEEIEQNLSLANRDINYQEDISPWLGNMAIAFFPKIAPSFNNSVGFKPDADLLLIFGIKNPLKAYQFKQSIISQGKVKYQDSEYQGVKITSIAQSSPSKIYLAVLRNKLIITEKLSIMHQAIATYQGEPALANNAESKKLFKQKLDLENPLIQVYLTNYQLDKTFPVNSMTFGIGSEEKAIKLKTIANFNQSIAVKLSKDDQELILENFPESTVALVSGHINAIKISDTWSYFIEDYYPYLSWFLESKYNLSEWLMVISDYQDFFQLIDGEFSLGIALNKTAEHTESNLATGLILTMSDRQQANLALQKLEHKSILELLLPENQLYSDNFFHNFDSRWLNEDNLLLSWQDNTEILAFNQPTSSILQNNKFSRFYRELPRKNLGYFYLDIDTIMSQVNQLNNPQQSDSENDFWNSIESINSSSILKQRKKTLESDILLQFK